MSLPAKARVAFFLSADSFEGFYGGIFGLDRETFLSSYRNDFVWEYAEGLGRLGHHVTLYILSYGKPELRPISERLSVRFLPLPKWLRLVDPFTYRLRRVPGFHTLRDRVAYVAYGSALKAALIEDKTDLFYHQEIWTPRFDVVAADVRTPVIGAEHGAVYEAWMEPHKRKSLGLAVSVTCQSKDAIARALEFGGRPILLYNGIDTTFFTAAAEPQPRSKTILTVGRLVEEQKRFTDLIRVMQLLPEFSLSIVGDGPDKGQIERLADELGVSDRVQFLGFVSDRVKLRRIYQSNGVFVSSSAWEAVALVVLEAMSCEMPVVCTRIPSFEELITDGVDGMLVPVGAVSEIEAAVRLAYECKERLGQAARRTVEERYSADHLYVRLSELIEAAAAHE